MKKEYKKITIVTIICSVIYSITLSPIAAYNMIDVNNGLDKNNFNYTYVVSIIFFLIIFFTWSFYTFFMLIALFSKWGYRVKHFNKVGFIGGTPFERMRSMFFFLIPILSIFFMIKVCIYLINYINS